MEAAIFSGQGQRAPETLPDRTVKVAPSSDDAVIELGPDGRITRWNAAAGQVFDLDAASALGTLISSRKLGLAALGIARLLAEATGSGNPTPVSIDLSISIAPVLDSGGKVLGSSLTMRDISERVSEQRRRTLVVQDLYHRMRNTLAVVQATARQTFRDWKRPDAPSARFLERLNALAGSRGLLDVNAWRGLSLRDIAVEQISLHVGGDMAHCACEGPDIVVQPAAATIFAMAFRELSTNSVKYGALSCTNGRVRLTWSIDVQDADRQLVLCWRECGGPAAIPPRRRGLGSWILEYGVSAELGGRADLRFHPTGLWYSLKAPLSPIEEPQRILHR